LAAVCTNKRHRPRYRSPRRRGQASANIVRAPAGVLRHLDVGRPDHLAPKLGFPGDELSELDRAHRHRHMDYLSHPRLDPGSREAGVDLTIERLDDLGRRTTRRDNTNP